MKLILPIFTILFFLMMPLVVKAEGLPMEGTSSALNIEVNEVANIAERLKEKITLVFKFSKEDKADYYYNIIEKRLAELVYVVDSGQGDRIEETSSRYSTYLGRFSEYVISNKLYRKKDQLLKMYDRHLLVLDPLQRNYDFDSGLWMLLEHDKNTIKIFSQKLSQMK